MHTYGKAGFGAWLQEPDTSQVFAQCRHNLPIRSQPPDLFLGMGSAAHDRALLMQNLRMNSKLLRHSKTMIHIRNCFQGFYHHDAQLSS
jgi:hypothetical protein